MVNPTTRKQSRINWRDARRRATHWFLNLLLVGLIAIILTPIVFLIITSFKGRITITDPQAPFLPSTWRYQNYTEMWEYINFGPLYRNSMIVVGTATAVGTFFAAMAGYALARFRFPGADAYGIVVMSTQLIPGVLFFIPLYLTFLWITRTLGIPMTGTNLGAVILYVGFFTPISTWILRSYFATLPPDLEEQAMVDGATRFIAFLRISLPLATPGIISTAIYIFLAAWEEMFFSYQLGVNTIPVGIRRFVTGAAGTQLHYDYMAAASVVTTIPLALMFFVVQKRFISGLTSGAVK
ncbi:MAG: carbohydrate ABC transporter permease [Anaerolineae bacterium]|nr:carbohydrate ABC transporter permease [Anaerolineae bacterium]